MSMKVWTSTSALLLSVVATGCSGPEDEANGNSRETATATGARPPITLRVGTPDFAGRPGALQVEHFAGQAAELSEGSIRVEIVHEAAGAGVRDWDRTTAQMVADGDLDMGLIPTRAFGSLGVNSLEALTAPLLIADQATLGEVISGELAEPLMSGLEDVGLVGVALTPEGLRHPFSFGGALLGPEDYEGLTFRAPSSATTTAMFEALGSSSTDLNGPEFLTAVSEGTVHAADSGFTLAAGLPQATVGTGNVTLYPKANALVVNQETFEDLDQRQQEWVRAAAANTRHWAMINEIDEQTAARMFCADGGTVVLASVAQIDELREAVDPVYDALTQDQLTADLITSIRSIAEQSAPRDGIICSPQEPDTEGDGPAPALTGGVYTYELTVEHLLASGIDEATARADAGVVTARMQDGTYTEQWVNDLGETISCTGEYVMVAERLFMVWTRGLGCAGAFSATAQVDGDTITWTDIHAIPPDPPHLTADWEAYLGVPWTRIE